MLDVSGSMEDRYGNKSNLTIKEVGACYAAALYINGNCDFVKFGNYANQIANPDNPDVHLMTALNDNVFKMLEYVENGGKLYDYINDNYHF